MDEAIKCPQCGTSVETGAKFCKHCGTPLHTAEAQPVATQGAEAKIASKKDTIVGAVVFLVLLLLVVWIATSLFGSGGVKPATTNSRVESGDSESEVESAACKAAEMRKQSYIYKESGVIPKTESQVIYKNDEYICVAVKYTNSDDFEDGYRVSVFKVRYLIGYDGTVSTNVYGNNLDGFIDVDHITKERLDEIKVYFELE